MNEQQTQLFRRVVAVLVGVLLAVGLATRTVRLGVDWLDNCATRIATWGDGEPPALLSNSEGSGRKSLIGIGCKDREFRSGPRRSPFPPKLSDLLPKVGEE